MRLSQALKTYSKGAPFYNVSVSPTAPIPVSMVVFERLPWGSDRVLSVTDTH
jgi:hypothetical protein